VAKGFVAKAISHDPMLKKSATDDDSVLGDVILAEYSLLLLKNIAKKIAAGGIRRVSR